MIIYRPVLNFFLVLGLILAFVFKTITGSSDIGVLTGILLVYPISFTIILESLLLRKYMRNSLRYIWGNGIEIHVSNEAKGDFNLYPNLVGSKILIALSLNLPAYIVAHSKREKDFIENIPGVTIKEADFLTKLAHFSGVSAYHSVTKKIQWNPFIRIKDIIRRWNYGCNIYKIEPNQMAISYLESCVSVEIVQKPSLKEISLYSIVLIMMLLTIVIQLA